MSSDSRPPRSPDDSGAAVPEETIGPYKIVGRLGFGGMGVVLRGFDERLQRHIAIKRIHRKDADDPQTRKRFRREARVAARLNHPGIVAIHDLLITDEADWLVMELVEGVTIKEKLESRPLSVQETLRIGFDITVALAYAHAKGVVHRDLKTSNVMWTEEQRAKILDFGLAKRVTDLRGSLSSISLSGRLAGSPHAMSPEQTRGQSVDFRSDLFSLGTLLYEMLTGFSPFRSENIFDTWIRVCTHQQAPVSEHSSAPSVLSDLIDKLLEKDPAHRPESTSDVARLFEEMLQSESAAAWSSSASDSGDSWSSSTASASASSVELLMPTLPEASSAHVTGERRQVTVLSCRLRRVADSDRGDPDGRVLDPEELMEVQDAFESLVRQVADRFGGYVPGLTNHSALICFGYPAAHEGSARRAIAAAMTLVDEIRGWRPRRDFYTSVGAAIAVHVGPGVVGVLPEQQLILGGTLNTVLDLLAEAGPDQVLVSAEVEALTRNAFETEAQDGVGSEIESPRPFRVVREIDSSASWPGDGQVTSFVGRQAELRLLDDLWQRGRDGQGQGVLITGEAGIGKSRLTGAFLHRAKLDGGGSLIARSSAYVEGQPLAPVRDLVRRLLRLDARDSVDALTVRLEEEARRLQLSRDAVDLLSYFLVPTTRDRAPVVADSDSRRRDLLGLLAKLILEHCRRPTVILFEDLHWLDPSTLELVDLLVPKIRDTPSLLILTCRPEFESPWTAGGGLTFLPLSQLDGDAAEAMVDDLVSGKHLPTALRRLVVTQADGVPLFLEELTLAMLGSSLGKVRSGGRRSREAQGKMPVPTSLRDLLTVRLDQLGNAKHIAQVAAVVGREFSYRLLEEICDVDSDILQQALEQLVTSKLVFRKGFLRRSRYAFKHALVQEAAYNSLLEIDRCHWHGRLAEVLEQGMQAEPPESPRDVPEASLSLVALHWSRSVHPRKPDPEKARKAVHYLVLSAREQMGDSAHREAAGQFEQVLEHLEQAEMGSIEGRELELEVRLHLATVWRCSQGWGNPRIKECYDRARELCLELGDRPELPQVLFGLWTYHLYHNYEASRAAAVECLEAARNLGQVPLMMQAHGALSSSLYWLGDLPGAIESSDTACRLARDQVDESHSVAYGQDPRIMADQFAVWGFWYLGQHAEADRRHEASTALAKELSHPFTSAIAYLTTINYERRRNDPEAVIRAADEMIELARELDIPIYEQGGRFLLLWAQGATGRAEEVADDLLQLFETGLEVAGNIAVGHSSCIVAEVYHWAGRTDRALELVERGLRAVEGQRELLVAAELYCLKAEISAERVGGSPGDREDAVEPAFREAYDHASRMLQVPFLDRAAEGLVELLRSQGRAEEALSFESAHKRRREEIMRESDRLVDHIRSLNEE